MDNWTDIKVGDFIKVLYSLSGVTSKCGIVVKIADSRVETLVEYSGFHVWSLPSSLEKCLNIPQIDWNDLKEKLKSRYNAKKMDNLTYIEYLALLNELAKSKKPL